jgi:hypothetical protein
MFFLYTLPNPSPQGRTEPGIAAVFGRDPEAGQCPLPSEEGHLALGLHSSRAASRACLHSGSQIATISLPVQSRGAARRRNLAEYGAPGIFNPFSVQPSGHMIPSPHSPTIHLILHYLDYTIHTVPRTVVDVCLGWNEGLMTTRIFTLDCPMPADSQTAFTQLSGDRPQHQSACELSRKMIWGRIRLGMFVVAVGPCDPW